jgi:2,3,4,5-tetrahydropyridine-2-carboxylate N-succinyltransferase
VSSLPHDPQRRERIAAAFADRSLLTDPATQQAVFATIEDLDKGRIRVAEPSESGWQVNPWVKQAVLLYFVLRPLEPLEAGALSFFDKVPVKKGLAAAGIRVVPPGVARYGSFLEPGCILMPGYVNIGAYVGAGTMIDTWATVGSCAQVGRGRSPVGWSRSGRGAGAAAARPVIIEDGAFIGSRCVVVEGVIVEREAVLGAPAWS